MIEQGYFQDRSLRNNNVNSILAGFLKYFLVTRLMKIQRGFRFLTKVREPQK